MQQEKYSLVWDQFPDHLRGMLNDMMKSEDLTDVTLICADQIQFKAHKVVLSACSEVFKNIIQASVMSGSVIYLRGIQSTEMKAILEFMYLGQATFDEDKILEFVNLAKDLKINEIQNSLETRENNDDERDSALVEDGSLEMSTTSKEQKMRNESQAEALLNADDLDGRECPECQKVFQQKPTMRQHFRSVHQGIRFPCDICGIQVTTKYKLIAHINVKHSNQTQHAL